VEVLGEITKTRDPEWEVSIPYNPPQAENVKYYVNVKNRKTGEKKVHDFKDIDAARQFSKDERVKLKAYEFEVCIYDEDSGEQIRKEYFYSKEGPDSAREWCKNNRAAKHVEIAREYKKTSSFFDNLVKGFDEKGEETIKNKLMAKNMDNEEVKVIEQKYMNIAKSMLNSLAETYKQAGLVSSGEFKALRLQIEEYSLGNLFYQMWINKSAIDMLMLEINKKPHHLNFTALGGLQKVGLEIGKMVREYMNDIEEFYKEASIAADGMIKSDDSSNLEQGDVITVIREEIRVSRKRPIPKSKNPNIKEAEDVEYTEYKDTEEVSDEVQEHDLGATGLESFNDDNT
jgi:hypothetical protein